jgi:FixJ family two-component response regulator
LARSQVMQKMQMHWAAHLVHLAEKLGLTMP